MKRRWARRHWRGLVAAVLLAVAAACDTGIDSLDPSLGAAVITREPNDGYSITATNGTVRATARTTNPSSNMRVVFWRLADGTSIDQESCATWSAGNHDQQPGIALRARDVPGGTQVITVTKNVWFHAWSIFNVHVMDSSNPDEPFVQIAGGDLPGLRLSESYNDVKPYPWRACARVVGLTVSLKVWPLSEPEPAWDDPNYGYSVTLPFTWEVNSGRPGSYVGHLRPGASMDYSDLAVTHRNAGASARVAESLSEPTTPPRQPTHILRAP